jgi:uncharacterized repeat protein (TIGR01451 family)
MLITGCRLAVLTAALALAAPALAAADTTIGSTAIPDNSSPLTCPLGSGSMIPLFLQISSDPSTPYAVPAGAWQVTSWQINTTGADPSPQVTFVVLRPGAGSSGSYSVLATDTETLPSTPPPSGVASFTLSSPIAAQGGDTIGMYVGPSSPAVTCGFEDATPSLPVDDQLNALVAGSTAPTTDQTLSLGPGAGSPSTRMNLSATLTPGLYDAGVSLAAGPANAVVGQPAVFTATVTNAGPAAGPITFVDPVPGALSVQYAGSDSGDCTTSTVNIVTCTFSSIPAGHSASVAIVVTPQVASTYSDSASVSVAGVATDPSAANNQATATLSVAAPANAGPAKCVVPKLGGASVALAKKVLPLLGCKPGATKKSHSKSVAKGLLIGTSPGAGSYTVNKLIALKVSSGPKPAKHQHKKK